MVWRLLGTGCGRGVHCTVHRPRRQRRGMEVEEMHQEESQWEGSGTERPGGKGR